MSLKEKLLKLIEDEGFEGAKSLVGLNTFQLLDKSGCEIDSDLSYNLIFDLFKKNIYPKEYKNCRLNFNLDGVVEWSCDWGNDEFSETYATPFWSGDSIVPVETYMFVSPDGELNDSEVPSDGIYDGIKGQSEFHDLEHYNRWIKEFYLPKVHQAITKHVAFYQTFR
jgi:hypothetical protein